MTIEIWRVVTSACLVLAVAFRVLDIANVPGRWKTISAGAQVSATAALAMTLALAAVTYGRWSPFDPRQIPLSLAVAALAVHGALCWRFRIDPASIILDLVALGLVLAGALAVPLGRLSLLCAQQSNQSWLFWVPFFLGMGGITVAGSAGLGSILAYAWGRHKGAVRGSQAANSDLLLTQSTSLGLVFLGVGLVLSTWIAWRTAGDLGSCDPREAWIALAWLLAATGSSARFLEHKWRRWTAGLAVLAAALLLFGVLGLADVHSLIGM
jgi:hypothetical protein